MSWSHDLSALSKKAVLLKFKLSTCYYINLTALNVSNYLSPKAQVLCTWEFYDIINNLLSIQFLFCGSLIQISQSCQINIIDSGRSIYYNI